MKRKLPLLVVTLFTFVALSVAISTMTYAAYNEVSGKYDGSTLKMQLVNPGGSYGHYGIRVVDASGQIIHDGNMQAFNSPYGGTLMWTAYKVNLDITQLNTYVIEIYVLQQEAAIAKGNIQFVDTPLDDDSNSGISMLLQSDGSVTSLTISGKGDLSVIFSEHYATQAHTIQQVIIKSGISSIGDKAFAYCTGLSAIDIPSSIKTIGNGAFQGCGQFTVNYSGSEEEWNAITIKNNNEPLKAATINYAKKTSGTCGATGSNLTWTFQDGTLTISGSGAMADFEGGYDAIPWYYLRDKIEQIKLPSGLTKISSYAFCDCTYVTSIKVPEGVTEIGSYAFKIDCIKRVDIPDSLTKIGMDAFLGCPIEEVHYAGTINRWQMMNIADGNSSLINARRIYDVTTGHSVITFDPNDGTGTMDAIVFDPNITLELPKNAFSAPSDKYFKAWIIGNKRYNPGDKFQFTGDTTVKALWYSFIEGVIDYGYCDNESDNTSWTLQDDGKLIIYAGSGNGEMMDYGSIAETPWFPYIDKIQSLRSTVTRIGSNAFASCPALKTVSLSTSVSLIQSNAFASCPALDEVHYEGSASQWDGLIKKIESGNSSLTTAKISYNKKVGEPYFRIGTDTNQFEHHGTLYKFHDSSYLKLLVLDTVGTNSPSRFLDTSLLMRDLSGLLEGVCHGVALSMAYANQGLLDYSSITPNADSYWHMGVYYTIQSVTGADGKPTSVFSVSNQKFSDMLLYYTLTQRTAFGRSTKSVTKGGWHLKSEDERLYDFLYSLVEEAKRSEQEQKPFVFSFTHPKKDEDTGKETQSGHSIVVYGYRWNEATQTHEVIVYDENDRYDEDENDRYTVTSENNRKLEIKLEDGKGSFSFQDSNFEYDTKKYPNIYPKGRYLQNEWLKLEYYGIDKVFKDIRQVNSTQGASLSSANSVNLLSGDGGTDSSDGKTTVSIPAFKKFRLQNAKGEYLSFDGSNYDGNMTVYGCDLNGLESDCYWIIAVDSSESFILSDTESSCALLLETNDQGYAVYADGANSVTISGDEVAVKGDSVHFDMDIASQGNDCSMYSASGTANGSVSLKNNGDTFTVNTDDGCSDFNLLSYDADFSPSSIISDGQIEDTLDIPKSTDTDVVLGDFNGDNKVNVDDVSDILDHIVNETPITEKQRKAADVNHDDHVNVDDVSDILDHIVNETPLN